MDLATQERPLELTSTAPESNPELPVVIDDIRRRADRFVFLSGGASNMGDDHRRRTLAMFDALPRLARGGYRLCVGDGGTQAGIMEAAGAARHASGDSFLLIGIAPAIAVPPRGATPWDPHHSHYVTVDDPAATPDDAWGTETATMYAIFARLAHDRPSVTVVVNGGTIALKEVAANVACGRPMIVVAGSGRAADAMLSLLEGREPADPEMAKLSAQARSLGLPGRPELFRSVPLDAGAAGLHESLVQALGPAA